MRSIGTRLGVFAEHVDSVRADVVAGVFSIRFNVVLEIPACSATSFRVIRRRSESFFSSCPHRIEAGTSERGLPDWESSPVWPKISA